MYNAFKFLKHMLKLTSGCHHQYDKPDHIRSVDFITFAIIKTTIASAMEHYELYRVSLIYLFMTNSLTHIRQIAPILQDGLRLIKTWPTALCFGSV